MQLNFIKKRTAHLGDYYSHIDGLRAIAIFLVFLNHVDISFFKGGFIGVDIFFVISGYLITKSLSRNIYKNGKLDYFNFIIRRTKRILPALIFTLSVSLFFAILFLSPEKFIFFSGALASSSVAVSNIFFSQNSGYFDIFTKTNPLLHTWSLGVEEQFYLFFPLILLFSIRYLKNNAIYFFVIASSISIALCYRLESPALYYLLPFRCFEFFLGVILALHHKNKQITNKKNEFIFIAGILSVILSAIFIDETHKHPGLVTLIPTIGTCLIIISGGNSKIGIFLKSNILIFFGKISYSFYLFHWVVIVFYKEIKNGIGIISEISTIDILVIFTITLILSILSFNLVEQRFINHKINSKKDALTFSFAILLLSSFLLTIGLAGYKSNGWLWRTENSNLGYEFKSYHQKNWGGSGYSGGYIYKNDSAKNQIIMMGDSHSGMLNKGFVEKIAKPSDMQIFTASGGGAGKYLSALLLPGTYKNIYGDGARLQAEKAITEVNEAYFKKTNSLLIYSSSYIGHLYNTSDTDKNSEWKINEINNTEIVPLLEAFSRLFSSFPKEKIIVIGAFPGSKRFDIGNCTNKLIIFSKISCDSHDKKSDHLKKIELNKILRNYTNINGIKFIDPFDYLCNNDKCSNLTNDGQPIYSDNSHMSKHGSIYFANLIKTEIENKLK